MSPFSGDFLAVLFSFAALAAVTTMAAILSLLRFGGRLPMDVPNTRSLHSTVIPRIGGAAMMLALSLPFMLAWPLPYKLVVAGGGAALLAGISLVDDWVGLSVVPRLVFQLSVSASALLLLDWSMSEAIVLTLALVWMSNLYNFMDGSDGLAGGMALFGFSSYGLAAAFANSPSLATACFVIAAAALGFLAFNFPPARVFMGDAGSVPLGFLAGMLGVIGWTEQIWPAWFPVLVFSPFIMDASVTLVRRMFRRERVWQAHREHYYQRLVRMGWGHRRTALAEYRLMLATGASAVALLHVPPTAQGFGLAMWAAIFLFLMSKVDRAWGHR